MREQDNALDDANHDAHLQDGITFEDETNDQDPKDSQSEDIDYETEARALGWSPKEEWRGDEKRWVDAETFIERGKEILPVVNERNKKLVEEITSLKKDREREREETKQAFDRFEKFNAVVLEQMRSDQFSKIKEEQKQALDEGDDERYEKLEEKRLKIDEELKIEAPKPQEVPQAESPEIAEFKRSNGWFGADPVLTDYAVKYCDQMALQGMSVQEQLDATQRYIVETFPQKFKNPRRNTQPAVGKGGAPSEPKKDKLAKFSDLTTAEQKLARIQMKNFGWSEQEFLKRYSEMENL
jgi:hypothetical protein